MEEIVAKASEALENNPVVRALLGIFVHHLEPVMEAAVGRYRERRFRIWAAELSDDPDVTPEKIAEDEHLFAAFAVAACVMRTHSQERVSLFARMHASFLAGRGVASPDEFAEFLHLLESLSDREFLILIRLRAIAENTQGIRLGTRELLFQFQGAWTKLRTELVQELKLAEGEIDSIVQGLTRTGCCRVLMDRNGGIASACATERLETFLMALTKYDRSGIPKRPTIKVGPYS